MFQYDLYLPNLHQHESRESKLFKRVYLVQYFRIITLALLIPVITACGIFGGDERPVYQGAEYYKNLEIPPDLTAPDTVNLLNVPKPTESALQNFVDNNELSSTVSPTFDGVRVVNEAGSSWLEIDENVEVVWMKLVSFWENEGVDLVEKRPLLGFMETDWVERLQADAGFFRGLFQRFEPDEKDKFRVRITASSNNTDGNNTTRVSVAHSRIERVVSGELADEISWNSQPNDIEAEREIISRMALYTGLSEGQSRQLVTEYRGYTSLVAIDKTHSTMLTMKGDRDFVWQRAVRALDRMGMEDVREQQQANSIFFTATTVSNTALNLEEDEIAKSSWLMQWFSGRSDQDAVDDIDRQYHLELTELDGRVQVEIKGARGNQSTDEDDNVSGSVLAEQLRNILATKLE